ALAAAPALVRQLRQCHMDTRVPFRDALRAIGPESLPAILPLLRSKDPWARGHALELLRIFGRHARQWKDAVLPLFRHDPNASVRRDAVRALVSLDAREVSALPILLDALGDPEERVVVEALKLLARYGPDAPSAVPHLRALLEKRKDVPTIVGALAQTSVDL